MVPQEKKSETYMTAIALDTAKMHTRHTCTHHKKNILVSSPPEAIFLLGYNKIYCLSCIKPAVVGQLVAINQCFN